MSFSADPIYLDILHKKISLSKVFVIKKLSRILIKFFEVTLNILNLFSEYFAVFGIIFVNLMII